MSNFGLEKAIPIVRERITKHNISVGTINDNNDGYHETITIFWLKVAAQFLEAQDLKDTEQNMNDFILSEYGKNNFQLQFYSEELLISVVISEKLL